MPIDDILAEMNATEDQQAGVDRRFPGADRQRRQPQGRRSSGQSASRQQRSPRSQRIGTLDSPKDPPTTRQQSVTRETERKYTGESPSLYQKVQLKADRDDVGYIGTVVRLVTSVI